MPSVRLLEKNKLRLLMPHWFDYSKYILLIVVVIFSVACNTVMEPTQPVLSPKIQEISSTNTLSPTSEPSPTGVMETHLTIREPSVEQFKEYLKALSNNHFYHDEEYPYADYDDPIQRLGEQSENMLTQVEFVFRDMNGDGEVDLIATDEFFVAVLIWDDEQYTEPFIILKANWKVGGMSRTFFEDWTGDNLAEVVFDFRDIGTGTGFVGYTWIRYVIYCKESCNLIWHGVLGQVGLDHNLQGISFLESELQLTTHQVDEPILSQDIDSFAVYTSWPISRSLQVFTSTTTLYEWTGNSFELTAEKVITPAYTIREQATLSDNNEDGTTATISIESNDEPYMFRESCTLLVDDQIVEDAFDCKSNFTTVRWQDITNDGQDEIVIITLSYGEKIELQEPCLQQHLLAYEWDDPRAVEVADIRGCVVGADLYGVRFDDLDNDGQVEIVAADSWHTEPVCSRDLCLGGTEWFELGHRNEIYKWNGSSFIFSGIMVE